MNMTYSTKQIHGTEKYFSDKMDVATWKVIS